MATNDVVLSRWSSEQEEVHVLAVDDSFVDRKVIERLLRISSCKVTVVDSGIRALQFLGLEQDKNSNVINAIKVDLIITDYCMPGMTGYELLKRVKESSALKKIPVIIMSSENIVTRIDRCLEEGAQDFIMKPVKLSDVERIRDYMVTREPGAKDNKRKTRDECCCCDVLVDLSGSCPSSVPSSSPPSPVFSSPPSSPLSVSDRLSTLGSPSRRLRMTVNAD